MSGAVLEAVAEPAPVAGRVTAFRGQLGLPLTLLLLAPLALLLGWTFFLPIGRLLLTSFTQPALGLHNYRRLIEEPLFLQVILRTLWIARWAVPLRPC